MLPSLAAFFFFFFFKDPATTEISPLPLPDALPIFFLAMCSDGGSWPWLAVRAGLGRAPPAGPTDIPVPGDPPPEQSVRPRLARLCRSAKTIADRKSTRLNSSHSQISYAVFCLKKKK